MWLITKIISSKYLSKSTSSCVGYWSNGLSTIDRLFLLKKNDWKRNWWFIKACITNHLQRLCRLTNKTLGNRHSHWWPLLLKKLLALLSYWFQSFLCHCSSTNMQLLLIPEILSLWQAKTFFLFVSKTGLNPSDLLLRSRASPPGFLNVIGKCCNNITEKSNTMQLKSSPASQQCTWCSVLHYPIRWSGFVQHCSNVKADLKLKQKVHLLESGHQIALSKRGFCTHMVEFGLYRVELSYTLVPSCEIWATPLSQNTSRKTKTSPTPCGYSQRGKCFFVFF